MDLRRLRAGEWLAATGGIALIVALLLPWYGVGGPDPEQDIRPPDLNGFEALTVIDLLLAALALLALSLAILQATRDEPNKPVAAAVFTAVLGLLGIMLVLFRIVDQPARDLGGLGSGAWTALAAAVAIAAGGWRSLAVEKVRGLPPGPEPELRPPPRIAADAEP